MTGPDWLRPSTHARHDLRDPDVSSFDSALHVTRYEWVRDTFGATDRTAVDLGCGTGFGCAILAERMAAVVGVDFAAEGLAAATARHGSDTVTFVDADLTAPDLVDAIGGRRFDVVTSMETIEHLEDYVGFAANAARATSPDGVCVIATPNRRMTYERYPQRRHMDPSHVQEFTRLALEHVLAEPFATVELWYQWIPGYWDERGEMVSTAEAPRVGGLADWVPPKLLPALRTARARVRREPAVAPRAWTAADVAIVPAAANPDREADAFCLLAVCRDPRPS